MQNFLFDLEKLTKYYASAHNALSSNPCVGHLPRIKISIFLLSIRTNQLLSTPKILTFFYFCFR